MWCLCSDSSSVQNTSEGDVASSQTAGNIVNEADEDHKKAMMGKLLPSRLLSRSATEFELECEADDICEKAAKRLKPDEKTASVTSNATDLMSSGLEALNSVNDDEMHITDTGSAVGMKVSSENVLPHLKRKRNYNAKASHLYEMSKANTALAITVPDVNICFSSMFMICSVMM